MASKPKSKKLPKQTDSYEHDSAERTNLPSTQTEPLMSQEDRAPIPFSPAVRERDDEPVLAWQRKPAATTNALTEGGYSQYQPSHDAYPLYIREKIRPEAFIGSLRREDTQGSFFESFNGLPSKNAQYEWYRHKANWQNRIIHGESARVMASLAGREGLTGQVQMIYFDPPYGIGFKSNFQTKTNNLETAENRRGLPNDTRTLTAFRDTYERGVHSYLDQMIEKLTLCRELLTESGSVFVQIGKENLHRMALILDEVFGAENSVSQITYSTGGTRTSSTLPSVSSYLLWYAKDIEKVKYRQLYESVASRKEMLDLFSWDARIELEDGTTRPLTAEEKADPDKNIPTSARLCQRRGLVSQGFSQTGRSEPYTWNGGEYQTGDTLHWSVSHSGLDRLAELDRLDALTAADSLLYWKRYEEEVPGKEVSNVWGTMNPSNKLYVVQVSEKVVERCMLMATDPGDLVFDPTCGSGTTAAVAETWGRRWITCDTSPISVAIARQRLITSTYPYWVVADSTNSKDPAKGFNYKSVTKVSAGILAYDRDVEATPLVDKPEENKKIARVASAFTVESSSPLTHVPFDGSFDDDAEQVPQHRPVEHSDFVEKVVAALKLNSISSGRNATDSASDIQVTEIEPWPGNWISHLVSYTPADNQDQAPKHAALFVVPEDTPASAELLRRVALDTASQIDDADLVIVVALAFEAEADAEKFGRVNVMRVQMHRDLQLSDLKPDDKHQAFVMVGQPDVEVKTYANGELAVELRGFDTYDPTNGNVKSGGKNDVDCWMIDTNYDGESFFARRIHFPGSDNDKIMKRLKKELGNTLDLVRWDRMLSTKSARFSVPETGRIAIKIITTAGNEMSVVKEVA